jgi:hypothetical protein
LVVCEIIYPVISTHLPGGCGHSTPVTTSNRADRLTLERDTVSLEALLPSWERERHHRAELTDDE